MPCCPIVSRDGSLLRCGAAVKNLAHSASRHARSRASFNVQAQFTSSISSMSWPAPSRAARTADNSTSCSFRTRKPVAGRREQWRVPNTGPGSHSRGDRLRRPRRASRKHDGSPCIEAMGCHVHPNAARCYWTMVSGTDGRYLGAIASSPSSTASWRSGHRRRRRVEGGISVSHHYSGPDFGFPRGDARLDFTDLYAFPKPGDPDKSILAMNVHPSATAISPGQTTAEPFMASEPADDDPFVSVFARSLEHSGAYLPNEATRVAGKLLPDVMSYDPIRPVPGFSYLGPPHKS